MFVRGGGIAYPRVYDTDGGVDDTKCLRDETQSAARRAILGSSGMRALTAFAREIRLENEGLDVPFFVPLSSGVDLECLLLMEALGARAGAH